MKARRGMVLVGIVLLPVFLTAGTFAQSGGVDKGTSDAIAEPVTSEAYVVEGTEGTQGYGCVYAGYKKGLVTIRLSNSSIKANSYVVASASEGSACNNRHLGSAKFTVHNVVPKDGYVDVRVNIEWSNTLPTTINVHWYTP